MSVQLVSHRAIRAGSVLALGLGLSAPIGLAGPAGATTSSATAVFNSDHTNLVYTAAAGQINQVTVTESTNDEINVMRYVIDDVVPITIGTGCFYTDPTDDTKISCTVAVAIDDPDGPLTMDLGDGDDTVTFDNRSYQAYYGVHIDLGAGNDRETDASVLDVNTILGGAGNDTITVADKAWAGGGDGNDTLHVGTGATAVGGAGNDVIYGGDKRQTLSGDDGNDTIYGGKGPDTFYGGKGNDVLYGNSGNDALYGNSGNDKLYGGPGNDTLSGGPGTDVLHQS
jgi:Ca2+-binding RTX toxin-like protein